MINKNYKLVERKMSIKWFGCINKTYVNYSVISLFYNVFFENNYKESYLNIIR